MNWKEFLKPDWRKIALTIIIFLFFIGYWVYNFFVGIFGWCEPCNHEYYLPWESGACGHCGYPDLLTYILIEIYWPLAIIIALFISYLLSCLIVWIYDKFRKVKKK
jgi:hypothetical protein